MGGLYDLLSQHLSKENLMIKSRQSDSLNEYQAKVITGLGRGKYSRLLSWSPHLSRLSFGRVFMA